MNFYMQAFNLKISFYLRSKITFEIRKYDLKWMNEEE